MLRERGQEMNIGAASAQTASPAVMESALYLVLDRFTPQEIGITSSTPTDPPTLTVNPVVAQIWIIVGAPPSSS